MIDLKKLRERAGLSQVELASRTGLTQGQISRYEQNTESLSAANLKVILQALGIDAQTAIEFILDDQPLESPVDPGKPYVRLEQNFALLNLYLDQPPRGYDEDASSPYAIEAIRGRARQVTQRPRLVLAGAFDTGKSHLINRLLGKDLLPTGYTPMTRLPMHLHHVDLKPKGLHENVVVLGLDKEGNSFDSNRWHDLEHIRTHELMRGNHHTLKEYGTHDSENALTGAEVALVFDDALILNACSIIDTPGDLHDPGDLKAADKAASGADILVYTSSAKGFMNGSDFIYLESCLEKLPLLTNIKKDLSPLGNAFFVATHADPSISTEDLKKILNKASDRMYRTLGETVLKRRFNRSGLELTNEYLRTRFFTFWREIPDRRRKFEMELGKALSTEISDAMTFGADQEVLRIKSDAQKDLKAKIEGYETAKANIAEMAERLKKLKDNEPAFLRRLDKKRQEVARYIQERKDGSSSLVQPIWDEFVNADVLEKMIREKFDDKKDGKKEAQEHAAQHLLSLIQDRIAKGLDEDSRTLASKVEEYLEELEGVSFKPAGDAGATEIPFNAEGAFLGGLAGIAGIGALSLYASTFGSLGSYILVAKGVSVLSMLGISISGGTAAAISSVSAIGGPITIAIGLGILGVLAGLALFGSWQKRLAKNITTQMVKRGIREQLAKGIEDFWEETEKAFNLGSVAAENAYQKKIRDWEELVKNPAASFETISRFQKELEAGRAFFANMPWKADG